MNRNDFLRMIESSGPADRATISEVSELINIFPYFQSAYLLLLKGLQNTSDVKFENQLRTSAMHIADREVLYYLLRQKPEANEITEKEIPQPVPVTVDTTDSQQVVIESARNSEDFINEIEKESISEEPDDAAVDQNVLISEEIYEEEYDAAIIIIDGETGSIEEKITYLDPGFSVPELSDLLELEPEEKNSTPTAPVKESVSQKQLQSALIDKFIIANPRIEPKREKTETPNIDISTPYVEERGGFVTETLARIYINQGYYSKAIDIYERLCLKFPEKSSYFASQIEKVKEVLKK
ncbi:MAG: tetratricopeptide repeat-containing protein [Bacteroidales bacterium]|jgi:tetratricopeptide (TPR) repeat protein|nr:tetratricopeptide repeat-containing protein [Bacteroidales bacterium]